MAALRRISLLPALAAGALLLPSCRMADRARTPQYAAVSYAAVQASFDPVSVAAAVNPVVAELAGPHPVEDYVSFALSQNAGIQAARSRVEAAAMRVPQAASLKDPMLGVTGWPIYPNVPQTASGRMTVDMMVSQEVPWRGKLGNRAAAAEQEVNAARAQLAAAELATIEQVKRAYYQLHFVEQSLRITEQNRKLLADVLEIADARYKTGKTSQQDVLRLQAESSSVEGELVKLRQERASAQADLAQLLHVSPETAFETLPELPAHEIPRDIDLLYAEAVAARPELHALLAEIERDRRKVALSRLEYRPDVTFGVGWGEMSTSGAIAPTADGIDNLTAAMSLNLPVYRRRLEAGVREAEAQVVASARQYDQMRDATLRDVKNLFATAVSQRELARLFRESIVPNTQQALEVSIREYQVGETTFVQMIDNWRELLRLQIMQRQIEAQLRQTLASLARVVGADELPPAANTLPEVVPVPPRG
jgi:outer membrane protein TolC